MKELEIEGVTYKVNNPYHPHFVGEIERLAKANRKNPLADLSKVIGNYSPEMQKIILHEAIEHTFSHNTTAHEVEDYLSTADGWGKLLHWIWGKDRTLDECFSLHCKAVEKHGAGYAVGEDYYSQKIMEGLCAIAELSKSLPQVQAATSLDALPDPVSASG